MAKKDIVSFEKTLIDHNGINDKPEDTPFKFKKAKEFKIIE